MQKKGSKFFINLVYILLLEMIYIIGINQSIKLGNLIYIIVFSLIANIIITLLSNVFSQKVNKILFYVFNCVLALYFIFQLMFYKIFKMPFSFSSISLADQAWDFMEIATRTIKENIIYLLLFLVPIILLIILKRFYDFEKYSMKEIFISTGSFICTIIISLLMLYINKAETYSAYNLYYNMNTSSLTVEKFGVLTSTYLDIMHQLTGFKAKINISNIKQTMKEEKIEYNEIDIDFDALIEKEEDEDINSLHEYFKSAEATNKNEYTGMYKGKNLIFILAEGFNSIAVDKELTPTLYKMVNSSFVFNNFYSPLFLSTTGGEFQSTTGLIPTQETLKLWKENLPYLKYSYGNAFKNQGYYASSYHNWSYTYYNRDETMATQGFDNYLACKNGLEKLMDCKTWPTSDISLIDVTTDKYMNEENFMTFYITVSGHAEYNFSGNAMAKKNKDLVSNLEYSESIQAYLASQMELDKALELLLERLEEKDILDDTVIALVGDHYPYTLSAEVMNEISTTKREETFEVHRSNFILYNSETKKQEIDKYAGNLDVLPTILNLFGIKYDSRMIMGKDILSDSEGLVIFSDHSWISDKGKYNATTKEFTPFSKKNISPDYVENINRLVSNKFTISNLLIDKNYYKIIEESRD